MTTEIWLVIIGLLTATIAWFLKRIMDSTDKMASDVSDMKPKVNLLWIEVFSKSQSPRQLNERGTEVLNQSGIKEIVEQQKEKLLEVVRNRNPKNPYDAERLIMRVMANLPEHCPELVDKLKQGAFETGATVDVLLFVGGLYLRNLIFPSLGFSLDDLDKPSPSPSQSNESHK